MNPGYLSTLVRLWKTVFACDLFRHCHDIDARYPQTRSTGIQNALDVLTVHWSASRRTLMSSVDALGLPARNALRPVMGPSRFRLGSRVQI